MEQENNKLALVSPEDLSLVGANMLNPAQLKFILSPTPQSYIKQRPAKGGGTWVYVPGGYIKKVLNLMFGWDWDFEVVKDQIVHGQVVVLGRLTCRCADKTVIKMQYGGKDIVFENDYIQGEGNTRTKKKSDRPLDIGNDFKAACTDALKKCAAELGIAADIYNKEEFRHVNVDVDEKEYIESEHQYKTDYPENNGTKEPNNNYDLDL